VFFSFLWPICFGDNKNNMIEYCVRGFLFTIYWKIIIIIIIICRDLDLSSTSYYLLGCELYQESLRKSRVHSNTLSYDVIAFWGSSLVRLHKYEEKKKHLLRFYSPSNFLSIMHNYQTTNNNQYKKQPHIR
jgi:hypothetical protein